MLRIVTFLFLLPFSFKAHSYANYISYGYGKCLTCHYKALGNGPLNNYGRALSATAISANLFGADDQKLSDWSNFFGKVRGPNWLRLSGDFRIINVQNEVGTSEKTSRSINMQQDLNVVMKFGEMENLVLMGSYGLYPKKVGENYENEPFSREYFLRYQTEDGKYRIYAGKLEKAYGIRIPDHVAFARQGTRLNQNDQSHGVMAHSLLGKLELAAMAFLGNLEIESDLQQKGGSLFAEYQLHEHFLPGFSFLFQRNKFIQTMNASLHFKWSAYKGGGYISEFGISNQDPILIDDEGISRSYAFLQNYTELTRGLHLINTVEYASEGDTSTYRWGPGVAFYPFQRVEVRTEFSNSRIFGTNDVQDDSWSIFSQLHIYL